MPYTVKTWTEGYTGKAADLNKMENGIFSVSSQAINVKEETYGAKGDGVTDDTTAIQNAVTAAAPPGEVGAVFFPPGTYKVTKAIKVGPYTRLFGVATGATIIKTTSTTEYIFKCEEGINEIDHLRFQAASTQTAGGAVDMSNMSTQATLTDLIFGNNFKTGINCGGAKGPSAVNMQRLTFEDPTTGGLENTGTCIRVGDGVNLSVGVWIRDVFILGKTTAGIKQAIELNRCDSCVLHNVLVQTVTKGIGVGVLGKAQVTGLKLTDCVVDTCLSPCYDIALTQDMTMKGCNAQGGTQGIVLKSEGAEKTGGEPARSVRISDCMVQINAGEGIIGEAHATEVQITGCKVISNNTGNAAGLAGIHMIQSCTDWQILNNRVANDPSGATGHQKKGIYVEAGSTPGAADKYLIANNSVRTDAEQTVGVDDKGAGTNKSIGTNPTF